MKNVLLLLQLENNRWRAHDNADSVRGIEAKRVIWVRTPTQYELDTVSPCVRGDQSKMLWLTKILREKDSKES